MPLISKLPDVGTTIFTVMSKLAADHQALNLSQGFPDFDPAPELVNAVASYMHSGHNQYAPMQGVLKLRQQLADKVRRHYQAKVDPETEITVTAGATEALFAAIAAVVRTGDEVIIIEPAYDAYAPAVTLNQGAPVYVPLTFPDYRMDWDRLAEAVTSRTRLIILNSPHNPTRDRIQTGRDIAALRRHPDRLPA